ncbi:MAG: hypothetical protein OXE94_02230 [Aestuariivita sp.]|nr:hypothetical protein [Aestuariivita sp.]MCY4203801.1 hypothetical protein [Aestuariivita sp.]MCY4288416.1 hypothetical protein [Aestuariivita sp.]MCY4345897.1 hypothetical protein [Aestuariivita sp.]
MNLLWLVAAGGVLRTGFLLLYAALNIGDVVVVAPFIATMHLGGAVRPLYLQT